MYKHTCMEWLHIYIHVWNNYKLRVLLSQWFIDDIYYIYLYAEYVKYNAMEIIEINKYFIHDGQMHHTWHLRYGTLGCVKPSLNPF
jgi:hypothetical protein